MRKRLALAGVALVLIGYPFVFGSATAINIGVLVMLFAMLGTAWNLLGGYAGQISFGHGVFFGLGAYTSTLLLRQFGLSPWAGMLAGAALAAAVAIVVGWPTFRLAGHYFAIATIVVGEITHTIVRNADALGGARGLSLPILPGSFLNYEFHEGRLPYYFVALGLYTVALLVTLEVERRRIGFYLRAIREDQTAAQSVGVSVLQYKLAAAALSAALAALGGTFYAQYVLFIDADSVFPLSLSILIALVPILGGAGHAIGPLLGAAVLIPLSELTRITFGGTGQGLDLVIYGGLIVIIAVLQPGGLVTLPRRLHSPVAPGRKGSA
ncbi:MAG TPA: branched-chain amino acid ABC transporter permease [Candidatus Limnocylindria bacterium]|nr:branched-chain amino acid ABC transporter permease [Candidatus Limnocylindria bacterium]